MAQHSCFLRLCDTAAQDERCLEVSEKKVTKSMKAQAFQFCHSAGRQKPIISLLMDLLEYASGVIDIHGLVESKL